MRNTEGTSSAKPAPRQSMRWPLIVAGLLACHVVLMLTVAAIAVRDPSFTVLPDYYQKALNWDQEKARRVESSNLGWTVVIEPAHTVDPLGSRSIKLSIRDKNQQPITGATLKLSYYHHAHASDVVVAELKESAPGEYLARLPMRHAGFWQFDLAATTAEHTFTASMTQFVENEAK